MRQVEEVKIGVAMGSNLGDSRAELDAAVAFLRTLSPDLKVSSYYTSSPVDCPPGSGDFINAVAEMDFHDGTSYLLDRFQKYEKSRGRAEQRETNAPRPMDLDILYAEDLEIKTARLELPHPRLAARLFVLEPLAEIAPDRVLPGLGPVRELLAKCRNDAKDQVCRKIE